MYNLAVIVTISAISPFLLSNTPLPFHEWILTFIIRHRDIFCFIWAAPDIPFTIITLEKEHTSLIKANNLSIFSINTSYFFFILLLPGIAIFLIEYISIFKESSVNVFFTNLRLVYSCLFLLVAFYPNFSGQIFSNC